jgi:hydroxyacylglutathione hydrolase
LREGEQLTLPGLVFDIIALPGHTLDHIAYFQQPEDAPPRLFCGDTLFAAGCGRMFEGNPEQMLASLDKLAALPEATLVYCGHEYTLPNLDFARHLEPDNRDIAERCITELAKRRAQKMTLPSTIGLEIRTNPFLRCHLPAIRHVAEDHCGHSLPTSAAVFACVRQWKDSFQTGAEFLDHYGRNP